MSRFAEMVFAWRRTRSRFLWFSLAMFLMSMTLVMTVALLQIASTLKDNVLRQFQLEVYLQPTTNSAERDSVLLAIKKQSPSGTSFQYISAGEARERFIQEFGSDLLDLLGENPLPPSYIVTLPKSPNSLSKMHDLQKFASDLPAVDEAIYENELAGWVEQSYEYFVPYLVVAGIVIACIIMVVCAFIVRSAVKHSTKTANTFLLLGAGPSYFRQPYRQLTALLGGATGIAAVICGWVLVLWLSERWSSISLSLPVTAAFIPIVTFFIGGTLGWVATRGIGRKLKHTSD